MLFQIFSFIRQNHIFFCKSEIEQENGEKEKKIKSNIEIDFFWRIWVTIEIRYIQPLNYF